MKNLTLADEWLYGEDGVIIEAVDSNSFCVFQWKSASNGGKSWAAIQLARNMQRFWRERKALEGRIEFAHFWGHATQLFDDIKARVADHIICDEESEQSGDHSATDTKGLKNILKACRAKGTSFSFLDPDPRPKPNVTAFLRIIGILKDAWVTWCVVFSPGGTAIGNLFMKIDGEYDLVGYDEEGYEIREYLDPDWAEIMAKYEPAKMQNIDDMIKNRGLVGSDTDSVKEKFAKKLYEEAQRRYETDGFKSTKENLMDWVGSKQVGASSQPFNTRKAIVNRVFNRIKKEGLVFRKTERDKSGTEWRMNTIKIIPLDIPEVWKKIEGYMKKQLTKYNKSDKVKKDKRKKLDKRVISWLRMWIVDEMSQQAIGDGAEVDQITISRQFKKARATIFGYAVEDWIAERYPNWKHKGGNTPEPDFVTDEGIVVSTKARCRANPQIEVGDTGKKERALALATGKLLQLWYFEFKYDPRLEIINFVPLTDK